MTAQLDCRGWLSVSTRRSSILFHSKKNNSPDLYFVMHFHVDRTVRAKNENLSPGIFTVNAFAFALFSLARQSFVHSLTTTTKTCHSIANTLVRNTALMAKLATTDSPSTPTSLNTKDTTEGKFEHKRIILVPLTASPPMAPHLPKLHGEQNPRLQQHNITFAGRQRRQFIVTVHTLLSSHVD